MSCVHVGNAIVTLSDECRPFYYLGKRYSVSEQWGPFRCDAHGDPLKMQPVSQAACDALQGAYEHYLAHIKIEQDAQRTHK